MKLAGRFSSLSFAKVYEHEFTLPLGNAAPNRWFLQFTVQQLSGQTQPERNHMMSNDLSGKLLGFALSVALALPVLAQEVLPFPPKPSGSIAARTMQESTYSPLPAVSHLTKDAPNILIVLIDDVGPAQSDTFGGAIHTPTMSRITSRASSTTGFTPRRCVRPRGRRC